MSTTIRYKHQYWMIELMVLCTCTDAISKYWSELITWDAFKVVLRGAYMKLVSGLKS